MKKTIAKIMAAAMILSAVPAVALPTLTANAAAPRSITISGVSSNTTTDLKADGSTGVSIAVSPSTATAAEAFVEGTYVSTDTTQKGFYIKWNSSVSDDTKKALSGKVTASIDGKGNLKVVASDSAAETLRTLVKDGTNTFDLIGTYAADMSVVKGSAATTSKKAGETEDFGNFRIGGTAAITSTVNYTAQDPDQYIAAGQIGVTVDTSGNATVLKGTSDIADNDDLRGQLLNLNEVYVSGVPYPVTKVGAQALKGAHMKKLDIENTKTIGKGALRKAKQMTKVDASDANKVRKIHSKAFYGDKNLKTIIIDGRKLNTVGSNAFNGVKKNCTIKIKAKKTKYNSDVKLIKKSGAKNVKFTRVAP